MNGDRLGRYQTIKVHVVLCAQLYSIVAHASRILELRLKLAVFTRAGPNTRSGQRFIDQRILGIPCGVDEGIIYLQQAKLSQRAEYHWHGRQTERLGKALFGMPEGILSLFSRIQ